MTTLRRLLSLARVPRKRRESNFGDQLIENCLAERVEVLRHHDEGRRPADDIGAIVFFQTAERVRVLRGE